MSYIVSYFSTKTAHIMQYNKVNFCSSLIMVTFTLREFLLMSEVSIDLENLPFFLHFEMTIAGHPMNLRKKKSIMNVFKVPYRLQRSLLLK